MNLIQRLEFWGDTHHSKWVDILRIALGVFLCFKGIEFLNNMSALMNVLTSNISFGTFTLMVLGHYIVFAHIIGGFLLAIGLLTRFAALVQIPILIGAIIFVNTHDILRPYSELFLSIFVLLLLIYFLIVGNGPWSFSWFVNRDKRADVTP